MVLDKLTYAGTLENLSEVIDKPNLEFIQGDICDSNLVEKLISNCDRVINFAAESHVDRSIVSAEEFVRTNVLGTQVILEAIRENPSIKFIQTIYYYNGINDVLDRLLKSGKRYLSDGLDINVVDEMGNEYWLSKYD